MPNESNRSKLEQGRAAFAYKCAEEGAKLNKKKEYKAYVKRMPMYIKSNGLGAAMAFGFSKGSKGGKIDESNAWGLLHQHIEHWLKEDEKELIDFQDNRLASELTRVDSPVYRAVTVEVIAFLSWLRRFAEGLIEGEDENIG